MRRMLENLPLKGIKVIDAASFIAAPLVSAVMSDYGADVIKLEPLTGDSYRDAYKDRTLWPENMASNQFLLENRNKKSLTINLKTHEGQKILKKLLLQTDVFITNLPKQPREILKVTDDVVRKINPKIIYASLTGYGESGSESTRTALDATAWWAQSGMMNWHRNNNSDGLPLFPIPGIGDHPTGIALLSSILLALINRNKTGLGTTVSTSLLANGIWSNAVQIQSLIAGNEPISTFRWEELSALRNLYRLKDKSLIFLLLTNEKKHWIEFLKCFDLTHLKKDVRFSSEKNRQIHRETLKSIIQRLFEKFNYRDLENRLSSTGIVFSKVSKSQDIINDSQLISSNMFIEVESEQQKNAKVVAPPLNISNSPRKRSKMAPKLGEHNEEILMGLGYTKQEISKLRLGNTII